MSTPFGLYVHWPFCVAKCPYCDFNSTAGADVDGVAWGRRLAAEVAAADAPAPDPVLASVFFGGGTPSLMPPAAVEAVLSAAAGRWPVAPDVEVTLEANPGASGAARFRDYAAAGVNRLSVGVQALDDDALAFLGRQHDRAAAVETVAAATAAVPRVSLDLMHGRPDQEPEKWANELREAVALGVEHLACYQLTVEPGTPFYQRGVAPPDEATAAALFDTTQEVLAGAGFLAYEVSNHALPGAECIHNLNTWRGFPYVGVGPGAHGRIVGADGTWWAVERLVDPGAWAAAVDAGGHGLETAEGLTPEERHVERLLLGLRLAEGVRRDVADAIDPATRAALAAEGLVEDGRRALAPTARGLRLLDSVLERLV